MHDLRVWPGVEGDGHDPSTTPGKTSGKDDEMSRLAKVTNKGMGGGWRSGVEIVVLW